MIINKIKDIKYEADFLGKIISSNKEIIQIPIINNIITTTSIANELDLRILSKIIQLLKIKDLEKNYNEVDYLQVFEIKDNKIINTQEIPEAKVEIPLNMNITKSLKIFAIRDFFKNKTIWTIMFSDEY